MSHRIYKAKRDLGDNSVQYVLQVGNDAQKWGVIGLKLHGQGQKWDSPHPSFIPGIPCSLLPPQLLTTFQ